MSLGRNQRISNHTCLKVISSIKSTVSRSNSSDIGRSIVKGAAKVINPAYRFRYGEVQP